MTRLRYLAGNITLLLKLPKMTKDFAKYLLWKHNKELATAMHTSKLSRGPLA